MSAPAPTVSARSPWLGRGVWTVLDQGSFAGANFVVNVLLARWLAPEGYGAYTVAYTLFLLVGVVHAGLLAEPMLVFGTSRFERRLERYLRVVLTGHVRFSGAAAVVLGLAAAAAWIGGEIILGHALAAFAVGQAAILFQWAMRSACYVRTQPRVAAESGLVYAALVVGGVAGLEWTGALNEATGIGLMATASLVAGLLIARRLGIPLRRDADADLAREAVARHREYGGWAVGTGLLEWLTGFLPFLLLPLWAGLGETGALRALFNLVLPILHLFHAASNLLVPAFVQAGVSGTRPRTTRTVALVFGTATLAFSVAVWALGPRVLHLLYDGQYDSYAGLLWIVAVLPLALAVSNVTQAMLRAEERPSGVFVGRATAAGVAVTLGAAAVFVFGVAGALLSDLLTATTESVVMVLFVRRGRAGVEASGGHAQGRDPARPERRHVLVVAFACGPGRGSEPGQGWEMASRLAARHDVTALVYAGFRPVIEAELAARPVAGLRVVYLRLPLERARHHARGVDRAGLREQLHYLLWTLAGRSFVRRLHDAAPFDASVHASFMRYWSPSPAAVLPAADGQAGGVPFLWGPVGGGESAPPAFVRALPLASRLRIRFRETVRAVHHALPPVRQTARRATLALATTDESAARMRRLGAPHVETARASVALSDDAFARLAALGPPPPGPLTAVFMGRLLDWKGVALALSAFARACADAPAAMAGARFVVVGDGPERDALERLAAGLPLRGLPGSPRVEFRGALPRDEALAALAEAHVLVHPSLHDSGGYATLEALAAARPVVCLALGGPAVQVTPDVGVAVPASTPDAAEAGVAAALVRLASDAALRDRMGRAGRARVAAHFRWSALAQDLADRLDGLIGVLPGAPDPNGHVSERAPAGAPEPADSLAV